MKTLLSVVCLLAFIGFSYQQENDDDFCSTPRNELGTCIVIRQCRFLYDLIEREKNNPRVIQYVKNSHCGVEGRLPKVCCPRNSQANTISTTTRRTVTNTRSGFGLLPDPEKNECGYNAFNSSKRIVGGEESIMGQWPWMVAIGFKTRNRRKPESPMFSCGGALISRRYVLTAAHCIHKDVTGEIEPYIIYTGGVDLEDQSKGVSIEIERAIMHERYSPTTKLNDIALLRLKTEVPLSNQLSPVCVPLQENLRSELFETKTPFVAGWGATTFRGLHSTKLLHIQISVVNNPTCQRIFANLGATINSNILCAGQLAGGKDSCSGDSGGPLMLPIGLQYYVIGVVSYGKKCAEPGYPGVYTRVTSYGQWILDNVRP